MRFAFLSVFFSVSALASNQSCEFAMKFFMRTEGLKIDQPLLSVRLKNNFLAEILPIRPSEINLSSKIYDAKIILLNRYEALKYSLDFNETYGNANYVIFNSKSTEGVDEVVGMGLVFDGTLGKLKIENKYPNFNFRNDTDNVFEVGRLAIHKEQLKDFNIFEAFPVILKLLQMKYPLGIPFNLKIFCSPISEVQERLYKRFGFTTIYTDSVSKRSIMAIGYNEIMALVQRLSEMN